MDRKYSTLDLPKRTDLIKGISLLRKCNNYPNPAF